MEVIMKLEKLAFTLSAITPLVLIGAQATAAGGPPTPPDDVKTYRATACQARPADVWRYEYGGIYNPADSPTEVEVVCPIVRDNVENDSGASIVVYLGVGVEPVECTFTAWSTSWELIDEVTGSATGVGFPPLYLWLQSSDPDGSYSLSCTLPPDSMIFSYEVQEPQG
jgi:hypothetical protein